MSLPTYSSRCPNCHKLLYMDKVEEQMSFGNSMRKCPYCSMNYIDSSVYEWVNLSNEEKKSVLVFGWNMTIVRENEVRSLYKKLRYTQFLLITIPIVSKLKRQLAALECFEFKPQMLQDYHIQESIERTKDENYIKILLKAGRKYYGIEYE